MFDLDELSRWDEALQALEHHAPEPAELQEAPARDAAPLRELEDA
ncbi:hypothetical protein SAMN05444722_2798 [Rhodovulum sp. ES.010]|nr:hypothetical protein [Rhodovulum sp. ES.010]SIO50333.1 hypothetical protein SAMN05444722_2798 [Rhodovulum sp. ES.010]